MGCRPTNTESIMICCYHVNTSVEVNIRTGIFADFSAFDAVCGACPGFTTVVLVCVASLMHLMHLLFLQIPLYAALECKVSSLNCNVVELNKQCMTMQK